MVLDQGLWFCPLFWLQSYCYASKTAYGYGYFYWENIQISVWTIFNNTHIVLIINILYFFEYI